MKIMFIRPGFGKLIEGYNLNDGRMEPLNLAVLAACTPDDIEYCMYDERAEEIPFDEKVDLLAITIDTFSSRRAFEICDEFRKRGVTVIAGGMHVTILPEDVLEHVDTIITGDGEGVWKSVLDDYRNGNLRQKYEGESSVPQKGFFPDRKIFKGKKYLPISTVQFGRGCFYNCSFCSVARFFKQKYISRDVDDVVMEIKTQRLKTILFADDNIVADRRKAKELFRALKPLKIRWASQASLDMLEDTELMELMVESGCIGNLIGFDSIVPDTLAWMNKKANLKNFDCYQKTIERLRSYGLLTWASLIIGNDFDTLESIRKTVEFAIESKFSLAFFHIFMPYPGTAIYDQMKAEGRLLYGGKWWDHPDYRYNKAAFTPKNMSPEELSRAAVEANKTFYTLSSIGKRLLEPSTNSSSLLKLFLYTKLNLVMRNTSI